MNLILSLVVAGCINGSLIDPAKYVQSLEAGFTPQQWTAAMATMKPQLAQYGIDVQHGSNGQLRPRIFLPTHQPPFVPDGDFGHTVDLIQTDSNGNPVAWEWMDYGGGYFPYPCASQQPPPPPSTDLEPRVKALEDLVKTLSDKIDEVEQEAEGRLDAVENRVKALEARPYYTKCNAALVPTIIPVRCSLAQ